MYQGKKINVLKDIQRMWLKPNNFSHMTFYETSVGITVKEKIIILSQLSNLFITDFLIRKIISKQTNKDGI